jgi:hypothetical protein
MENQELNNLKRRIEELERILTLHTHSGSDKTKVIGEGNIILKSGKLFKLGKTFIGYVGLNEGLSNEVSRILFAAGLDESLGYGNKSENSQIQMEHQEGTVLSFFYGFRPPLAAGPSPGDTINITSGENTISDTKQTFTTNELACAYISVVGRTTGTLETHLISSNTATQITIATTWGFSESVGYAAFVPMYLGAANYPWQRLYLMGDLRFGRGASAGANVIYIKYGSGSPEGVVTANIGSLYLRTDGSTSTTLYVKTSGTGNTGWSAK